MGVRAMKTKTPERISRSLQDQLEKYRDRLVKLSYTNERSRLVDLVTCLLEGTADGQKTNIGKD